MLWASLAFLAVGQATAPTELAAFVAKRDCTYGWSPLTAYVAHINGNTKHFRQWSLHSQTWRGIAWKHRIVMVEPESSVETKGVATLVITGGKLNDRDIELAKSIADSGRMPVAVLFDIPNQPLFGLNEDELIAYTFDKYIASADSTWPLLFPMVKSAVRAMDAIEDASKGSENPISKFVVTGESKRGWTTWLTAATGDKRIIGIAPMVFDNLNIQAQMKHQLELWGHYSPMIEAYTKRDLQSKAETERGTKLVGMVDPFSYLGLLTMPKFIVNGANDPYWTVDALSLYWNALPGQKSVLIVPNSGHDTGEQQDTMPTVGLFARSCAGGFAWPQPSAEWKDDSVTIHLGSPYGTDAGMWVAAAPNKDFADSKWTVQIVYLGSERQSNGTARFPLQKVINPQACMIAVRYKLPDSVGGAEFTICLPVKLRLK